MPRLISRVTAALIWAAFSLCASCEPVFAQSTVLQGGPYSQNHIPQYAGQGNSQAVLKDGGGAAGGAVGANPSEIGITANGIGLPPFVGQGKGPLGANDCLYDGPTNSAAGYHYLCFSANAQGGGLIAYGAGGIASPLPLSINLNGIKYPFPGAGNGDVLGPGASTVGDIPAFNSTAGNLLKDSGAAAPLGPMAFGCVGNGTQDDTGCMQRAVNAAMASGLPLELGPHLYKIASTVTAASPITIIGSGIGGIYTGDACTYGFIAGTPNLNLLTLTGNGSLVRNVCFQMGPSQGANTSGTGIFVGGANSITLDAVQVNYPFVGIDITGAGNSPQNVDTLVENSVIVGTSSGGAAIRVGVNSTFANTVDTKLTNNAMWSATASTGVGMLFLDSGGPFLNGNDPFQQGYGTEINPGENQFVEWMRATDVLGDTSWHNDLLITTGSLNGTVQGLNFVGSWASNAQGGASTLITAGAGGPIKGIQFVGHRSLTSSSHGIDIEAGDAISITGSQICGNAGDGVKVGSGIGQLQITGNNFSTCSFSTIIQAKGIEIAGNNSLVEIESNNISNNTTGLSITGTGTVLTFTGNTLASNTTVVAWSPSGETATVSNNTGIDNIAATVASASSIMLPINPIIQISGTTTITSIGGDWSSRHALLVPTSAGLSITGGTGSTCTNVSATQSVGIPITWNSGLACWIVG